MKVVHVKDGGYKVIVQSGGTIVLDTGSTIGNVLVTGNLTVNGTTTTINSSTLTVDDNIIVINEGEGGAGITLVQAGIEIDRGSLPNAEIFFNESISHYSPTLATTVSGTFVFRNQSGTLLGLRTNSIMTGGSNLALVGSGSGVITVQGTTNYEQNVLDYSDPLKQPINGDFIPNAQAMVDYVTASFTGILQPGIEDGDTSVRTKDQSNLNNPLPSVIEFKVDNVLIGEINSSGLEIGNIVIGGDTITDSSVNNLTITSNTGEVDMDAVLSLLDQSDPTPTAGACKIYTKTAVGSGNTGLYYVNTKIDFDGSTVINLQDELVSKNRALLFSMLF
jgi:hypothetical protein